METTRVQNEPAAASGSRADRASALQGPDRSGQSGTAHASSGSSDQIQISSLAGQIVHLAGAQSAARAGRVEELSKMYAAGTYNINPTQLSQKMVTEWLASSSGSR